MALDCLEILKECFDRTTKYDSAGDIALCLRKYFLCTQRTPLADRPYNRFSKQVTFQPDLVLFATTPVRPHSVRRFPKGSGNFGKHPRITSQTEKACSSRLELSYPGNFRPSHQSPAYSTVVVFHVQRPRRNSDPFLLSWRFQLFFDRIKTRMSFGHKEKEWCREPVSDFSGRNNMHLTSCPLVSPTTNLRAPFRFS